MRCTARLLEHAQRITLFTRANCSLCDDARLVLAKVWDQRPFEYKEVDVMDDKQTQWKDLYEFDTPVVHVQNTNGATSEARKLMHRFKEAEVLQLMDDGRKSA